jgi:hypothetical protein
MTKKKLNIDINKVGSNNSFILECIGEYNAGKAEFSPRDLEGYLNMKKAFTPLSAAGYCMVKDELDANTYHISEDGAETFTLSIEWAEIHQIHKTDEEIEKELQGLPLDDLDGIFD